VDKLAVVDPRKAKVVELRFFGGLNNDEIAEALQISSNTVMRDWNMAKAFLRREIESAETHA
jgi:DNA-directed RNA polymerase specialized sigma24 family protein